MHVKNRVIPADKSLSYYQADSTLVELLRFRALNQPKEIGYTFLLDGETEVASLTYQQLDQKARAIAVQLLQKVEVGSRVLLLYPPGLEFVAAFFGCLYGGFVAVPAYPPRRNQKMSRLEAIVSNAEAAVALTTASELVSIQTQLTENPILAALPWLATDTISNDLASNWQEPTVNSNTLAFLQYTSGATGTPKGAMITHGNLLHNSQLIYNFFGNTSKSKGVIWLPPYHDMGLIGGVLQPLYACSPVILISPVAFIQKPFRWLQAISHYQATTSGGPDFAYDLACRHITNEQLASLDLSHWEVAFTGAEPLHAEILERFAETFAPCGFRREAFYPCYGMAETTLIVSGGLKSQAPIIRHVSTTALEKNQVADPTDKDNVRTIVGCGKSSPDQKVIVVDPESLTRCPDRRVGEVWVSGASVGQGYWNQPEQTLEAFQAYLADDKINRFFRTGDLGFLLAGELFITGRLKDLITIMGRNHYPQDIEMTVEKSHPALRPASGAVFTVEINNSKKLVVVQEVERTYLRKLNASEVIGAIRKAVAEEHDLQAYAILLLKTSSLPKTSSGKIQRSACRQGFIDASLDVVADWSINPKNKSQFLHLELEVESLLQKLKDGDVQGLTSESQNLSALTLDNQQSSDVLLSNSNPGFPTNYISLDNQQYGSALSPLQIDLPLPATPLKESDEEENVTLSKPQQKRNFYPLIFILFGLLIAGVGLLIWNSRVNTKEPLRASGRIEGYETDIGVKVGGRIQSVAVREGDPIRKGQVLVKLDDAEIQAQLLGAGARVNVSQQQEQQARLQINLIESQIEETQLSLQQALGNAKGKIFEFRSSLASTQAQLNQAMAQLDQAKSELKLAQLNRDRFTSLVAEGAVTKQQFDQAQTRWETARSTVISQQAAVDSFRKLVNSAQGQLTQAQTTELNPSIRNKQLAQLRTQLAQARLKLAAAQADVVNAKAAQKEIKAKITDLNVISPIDGVTISRTVEPGTVVAPGKTLLTVINPNTTYLRAFIPQGEIGKITVGQEAQVFLDSAPKQPLNAKITAVDTQASFTPENVYFQEDRVKQVFGVKISIDNPAGLAKPGMPADAEIKTVSTAKK